MSLISDKNSLQGDNSEFMCGTLCFMDSIIALSMFSQFSCKSKKMFDGDWFWIVFTGNLQILSNKNTENILLSKACNFINWHTIEIIVNIVFKFSTIRLLFPRNSLSG